MQEYQYLLNELIYWGEVAAWVTAIGGIITVFALKPWKRITHKAKFSTGWEEQS